MGVKPVTAVVSGAIAVAVMLGVVGCQLQASHAPATVPGGGAGASAALAAGPSPSPSPPRGPR
ncbi:hypothetical protein, partial [Mesorhizobium japonicum]|uniref:hypothetical protein n=1 Tax=Mesorhizobium japonicum TaxID=2066070 RepID=UPI003B5A415B